MIRLRVPIATVALLAACGLAFASGANGLTPVPPDSASFVFSNGGRIFSADAKGGNRTLLAGAAGAAHNSPAGLTDPRVSPDGKRLAFVLKHAGGETGPDVWVADADGSDPEVILRGSATDHYSTPSWMPDSKTLLVGHTVVTGRSYDAGLIRVGADGQGAVDIIRQQAVEAGKKKLGLAVTRPVVSPDGQSALFLLADWRAGEDISERSGRLETVNLADGKRRLISTGSFGGSWSPDGQRIVYARRVGDVERVCSEFSCSNGARLFITTLDGRYETRVIAPDDGQFDDFGDERNPEWSPDGTRILFQSDRNMHGFSDAYEVYSVEPDGECLSWLTNGTPASIVPTWSVSGGGSTTPASCGDNGRAPLVELPPPDDSLSNLGIAKARYWFGGELKGRLYSGRYDSHPEWGTVSNLKYYDCAYFEPKACGSAIRKYEYSMCVYRGQLAKAFFAYPGPTFTRSRGVPSIHGIGDGDYQAFLISGDRLVGGYRETSLFDKTLSGPEMFAALRPLGSDAKPAGRLSPPKYPAFDIRRMKKIVRLVAAKGGAEKAAEALKVKPNVVKSNIRMSRQLPKFGPIRTLKCS